MYPKRVFLIVALVGVSLSLCLDSRFSLATTSPLIKHAPLAAALLVLLALSPASRILAPVFQAPGSFFSLPCRLFAMNRIAPPARTGGEIGGLANDGNTCFMNSVLQALASSRSLTAFFAREAQAAAMPFTATLKSLLDDLNGCYGSRGKEFSTRTLLKRMPDGPKQNFFMGYNQEDAQEFYQQIMRIVEKELEKKSGSKTPPGPAGSKFVPMQESTASTIYVPAEQIDPNVSAHDRLAFPLHLVTPVDGISAERIGCMSCGETGGIRYSVNSGLSLNLPYDRSYGRYYKLHDLLDEWKRPEVIDDVNCNRCGLMQTRDFLLDSMKTNEALVPKFSERIQEIELELSRSYVSDEVFERLTTKQMIRKTRKSKQIFLGTPPPLLCIHINRSVMDPNTFMIMKNSKSLSFPAVLDMSPYTADASDVNMDARRPFRKQDEATHQETEETQQQTSELSQEVSDSPEVSDSSEAERSQDGQKNSQEVPSQKDNVTYRLRAVISHMGTHNYGHYICYRHHRGVWWKANDEAIYATTEEEVLTSPGTFMLFYERGQDTEDEKKMESDSESSADDVFDNEKSDDNLSDGSEQPEEKHHIGEERAFHV